MISEASEFTYQQEASQRILLESKHAKDDDTVEGDHADRTDYINVASDTEELVPRSDFSRASSMQETKPEVRRSVRVDSTKIKLKKTPIAGSSGKQAVTRK